MHEKEAPQETKPVSPVPLHSDETVEDRLLGSDELAIDALIAYSLFVKYKREWAESYIADVGSYPDPIASQGYDKTWTSRRIADLRNNAQEILRAYSSEISAETIQNYESESQRSRKLLYYGIISNIFGAFIFINILVVFAIAAYKFDLFPTIESVTTINK